MQDMHHVPAIVDEQMRAALQALHEIVMVCFGRATVRGQNADPGGSQGRAYVVLRGQRVGAHRPDLRAAGRQRLAEAGRLGFQMDGHGHGKAPQRLFPGKALADEGQYRHMPLRPADFLFSFRAQAPGFSKWTASAFPP